MRQPIEFDFSRINYDVEKETVTVDDSALNGWEFHILTDNIDSRKTTDLSPHFVSYLVSIAAQHRPATSPFAFQKQI